MREAEVRGEGSVRPAGRHCRVQRTLLEGKRYRCPWAFLSGVGGRAGPVFRGLERKLSLRTR